jgi:hypothetical protein
MTTSALALSVIRPSPPQNAMSTANSWHMGACLRGRAARGVSSPTPSAWAPRLDARTGSTAARGMSCWPIVSTRCTRLDAQPGGTACAAWAGGLPCHPLGSVLAGEPVSVAQSEASHPGNRRGRSGPHRGAGAGAACGSEAVTGGAQPKALRKRQQSSGCMHAGAAAESPVQHLPWRAAAARQGTFKAHAHAQSAGYTAQRATCRANARPRAGYRTSSEALPSRTVDHYFMWRTSMPHVRSTRMHYCFSSASTLALWCIPSVCTTLVHTLISS